ncbi:MAG: VWA domain-containing protein [Paracoccaceae bacterium]|nr:VWA domain-containing protein [Paracoccaceae bacterium]
MTLPRALEPFITFAQALRRAGFAVSPDQTEGFIAAVGVLGPRNMDDIYRSGLAVFSVQPERRGQYDALFRAVFLGQTVAAPIEEDDDVAVEAYEPTGDTQDVEAPDEESEIGGEATVSERLGQRDLSDQGGEAALQQFARQAPRALPRRLSYRNQSAKNGTAMDMRRILKEAAKRDGEVIHLFETKRKTRQRRVLLLVDVSGSMKDRSNASMRLAHALVQAADHAEVFTLGTRLTRITTALRPADRAMALTRVTQAVADFDGGTRIGDALLAYLAVPRYAGFARGAAVVVLSDGLERGAPDAMIEAVSRLSRMAWRVDWLTPLASEDFAPKTDALKAILPHIHTLGDGSDTQAITTHILNLARAA